MTAIETWAALPEADREWLLARLHETRGSWLSRGVSYPEPGFAETTRSRAALFAAAMAALREIATLATAEDTKR